MKTGGKVSSEEAFKEIFEMLEAAKEIVLENKQDL